MGLIEGQGTAKQYAVSAGLGIIGGIIGGYPGMQIGMALGSFLFKLETKKGKDYLNTDFSPYTSAINVVPEVIGTDMCPGKVIWLEKDTFGVYELKKVPSLEGDTAWQAFVETIEELPGTFYAHFIFNYCDDYLGNLDSNHVIDRTYFNTKDQWLWLMLSDWFRQQFCEKANNYWSPPEHATILSNWGYPLTQHDVESLAPSQNHMYMYFKGLLGDFTALNTNPELQGILTDLTDLPKVLGTLARFPVITGEIGRELLLYHRDSFKYNGNVPGEYGCRDARNDYLYSQKNGWFLPDGLEDIYENWIRSNCILEYVNIYNQVKTRCSIDGPDVDDDKWWYDNITKGGSFYQVTDIANDRLYFFVRRNWTNPSQARGVYGIDKTDHHHADYSARYDIFYINRLTQHVTSVVYNQEVNISSDDIENSNAVPSLTTYSIEESEDHIWIFGAANCTDLIISDQREINATSTLTRVYADFSQYPVGWWDGKWASLQQENFKYWRQITNQTATYIDVDNPFGGLPSEGEAVALSKFPTWASDWSIVGEGSTTTKIITNPPGLRWPGPGTTEWYAVFYRGGWSSRVGISSINGTEVYLSGSLSRDPIPGEPIYFDYQVAGDAEVDMVNPFLPEYDDRINELGIDASWPFGFPVRASTFQINEFSHSRHVILRINKSDGVATTFRTERVYHPRYWGYYFWTGGVTGQATASTDKEIHFYSHSIHHGSAPYSWSGILDKQTQIISEEAGPKRNTRSSATAPACIYYGAIPVREWDSDLLDWVTMWYALCNVYEGTGENGSVKHGIYFLRLTEGRFSNKWEVVGDAQKEGLFLDRKGIQIIHFRNWMATTIIANMFTTSTSKEVPLIGKYDYNDSIYYSVWRASMYTNGNEIWKYIPPTDAKPNGELICINQATEEWAIGVFNGFGQGISCKYLFHANGKASSNFCDENPVMASYYLMARTVDPNYLPGPILGASFPYDLTNRNEARDYCNEIITDTVYVKGEEIPIIEPRFLFSLTYDKSRRMGDIVAEMMATTMGYVFVCEGEMHWKIPTPNETPLYYFGRATNNFTSDQLSDDYAKIYADFSAYPDLFWKGDIVTSSLFETYGLGRDWAVIIDQTDSYIEIDSDLDTYFPSGQSISINKDNMKEGSFTYAKKSSKEKANRIIVEFRNRLEKYIKDVAEAEDTYALDILGELPQVKTFKMHGIKRATQAGRMALRLLDYERYVNWVCAFETDVMGMTLCLGDIIGVIHDTTGWFGKWFRVVAIDELLDYEVRLELEEYNPYIYHDQGVPVLQLQGHNGFPDPYVPNNVERFRVYEDIEFKRLYFVFSEPTGDAGFFIGARIYVLVNGQWQFITIANGAASSVALSQSIDVDDTTIYYDPNTSVGSFPSQGVIWIEDELIYYFGIDSANNAFINVVRGYKETVAVAHTLSDNYPDDNIWIYLKDDKLFYYEYPDSWAGTTQIFNASALTIQGLTIDYSIAPQYEIDIVGYGVLPYSVALLHEGYPVVEYLFEKLGLDDDIEDS